MERGLAILLCNRKMMQLFTPLRVGWPPTPAGLFRSVRGAKGGVEYEASNWGFPS